MDDDRIRWDQRYAAQTAARPAPPDVIAEHPELLDCLPSTGRALDLACGAGAQSLWLAQRGLDVTALDVSPAAIGLLTSAAESNGGSANGVSSIDGRVHDTDLGLPPDLVDLSIIVCQRFRTPALYPVFIERLRIGGVLVLTVLSAVGLDGTPGAFHAPAGELIDAFRPTGADIVHHQENNGQASIVMRRIG